MASRKQQRQPTERVDINTYFLLLAQAAALRSTCPRRHVGCVLTCRGETVATGYNGSLAKQPHCTEIGCLMDQTDTHCIRALHAEENALLKAQGEVDTLYCTDQPCLRCFRAAVQRGVRYIYFLNPYSDPDRDIFVGASQRLGSIMRHIPRHKVPTFILVFSKEEM